MSRIKENFLRIRLFSKKCVRDEVLFKVILRPVHVNRWKVELGRPTLRVKLAFVSEAHIKDGTRTSHDKLWHLKNLLGLVFWLQESLRLNLLRNPIKVPENDSALREC